MKEIGAKRRICLKCLTFYFEENRPRSGFFLKKNFDFFWSVWNQNSDDICGSFICWNSDVKVIKKTWRKLQKETRKLKIFSGRLTAPENIDFEYIWNIFLKNNRFILKYFSFYFEENRPRSGRRFFLKTFFEAFFGREAAVFFEVFSKPKKKNTAPTNGWHELILSKIYMIFHSKRKLLVHNIIIPQQEETFGTKY